MIMGFCFDHRKVTEKLRSDMCADDKSLILR
eukprot:CAMPEP_0184501994 /NCGR_PEP_ID=MMETSP0113_2-20130426/49128_1 /TAXON_ID=91329 /ORGANISM="Norrisiella sphaerica, Strain BC52" /LENGTH=30 /DNA_ID= /DNA_START= /DNA_END= /DNA_ORIENTATION=